MKSTIKMDCYVENPCSKVSSIYLTCIQQIHKKAVTRHFTQKANKKKKLDHCITTLTVLHRFYSAFKLYFRKSELLTLYLQSSPPDKMSSLTEFQSTLRTSPS